MVNNHTCNPSVLEWRSRDPFNGFTISRRNIDRKSRINMLCGGMPVAVGSAQGYSQPWKGRQIYRKTGQAQGGGNLNLRGRLVGRHYPVGLRGTPQTAAFGQCTAGFGAMPLKSRSPAMLAPPMLGCLTTRYKTRKMHNLRLFLSFNERRELTRDVGVGCGYDNKRNKSGMKAGAIDPGAVEDRTLAPEFRMPL